MAVWALATLLARMASAAESTVFDNITIFLSGLVVIPLLYVEVPASIL